MRTFRPCFLLFCLSVCVMKTQAILVICVHASIYSPIHCVRFLCFVSDMWWMLQNIGLFCKRALQKRPVFCKETCIFKHPTNRSHPIAILCVYLFVKDTRCPAQGTRCPVPKSWRIFFAHRIVHSLLQGIACLVHHISNLSRVSTSYIYLLCLPVCQSHAMYCKTHAISSCPAHVWMNHSCV